jgi:hypothetical protein
MVAISIDNPDIKDKVKSGEIKGFSIEGFFNEKLKMSEDELLYNKIKDLINGV